MGAGWERRYGSAKQCAFMCSEKGRLDPQVKMTCERIFEVVDELHVVVRENWSELASLSMSLQLPGRRGCSEARRRSEN